MSITIGSTTLTDPDRSQMQETTADNVAYSCSASTPAPTYTENLEIYYSALTYEWSFSDGGSAAGASGNHTFTGLSKGSPVTLTATVVVKCVKTTRTRSWGIVGYTPVTTTNPDDGSTTTTYIPNYDWGPWSTTTANLEASSSVSQEANTHPGECTVYAGLAFNMIIEYNLTSGMVAEWCTHCGKWLSWKHQGDRYSAANGCNVASGSTITATWYNNCVTTAEAGDVCDSVSGGYNGTVIRPGLFHSLGIAISRRI